MTTSPRDRLLREVATRFLGRRAQIVAPLMLLALGALWSADAPKPQRLALTVGFGAMLAFFVYEARESRRQLFSAELVHRSLLLTLLGITLGCAATGGLASPLLPMVFAPVVVGVAAFGRERAHRSSSWALPIAILVLGVATFRAPFPPVPAPERHVMLAGALVGSLVLVTVGVSAFTQAHAALVDDLVRAREGLLTEALQRTRSVESLGAKVAHEIKNPLASIRGLVDLLAERTLEPRDARRVEVLRGEVQRLETLVHEYLTLARPLDALRREDTDLVRLGEETVALLEGRARAADVELRWSAPPGALRGEIDGQRLLLALLNLLVNAIEASPPASEVVLALTNSDANVAFMVADHGEGIAPEVRSRLGQPYVTTKPDGTGLGVALARSIVEQHGGTLVFAPRSPRGTLVTITMRSTSGAAPGEAL